MTGIVVAEATRDDLDAFVASVAGLFQEDAGRHDSSIAADWPAREGLAYYTGLLADDACLLLVARDDSGQVVGHLVGKLAEPDTLRPQRFAVLESMRVVPECRGRGVGSALIERFFGWARDRGAQQASVSAYARNEAAQRLYARHGFTAQSVTLRTVL